MKKLLAVLVAGLMLASLSAFAQAPTYGWNTIITSKSATCDATGVTNVAKVLDVRKQNTAAIQVELMADANGAYTFTIPIQYSVDGVVYGGMGATSIAVSFNGVTKQTIITNVPTYGAGFIKIPYLTNATAAINVTNIVLKQAVKMSAP